MTNELLLSMKHTTKRFPGVLALDDVDFEVYAGEILGLVGENGAGKSTLIKILSGAISRDTGRMEMRGQVVDPRSPQESQGLGIATIHQELALVPGLTVAQNIFLHREPRRSRLLDWVDVKKMRGDASSILEALGLPIQVDRRICDLTISSQQMVEIARAISRDAKLILMDEPTSSLSGSEVKTLFELIRRLRAKGVSIVFVSHRLEEVLQIVDRVAVMRDGRRVGTLGKGATESEIVQFMVGRSISLYQKEANRTGLPVIEVRNLAGHGFVRGVSFTVNSGEIVGLAGLVGAGRTEVARMVCGADPKSGGEILVSGSPVEMKNPADAVRCGIGLVPEDRKLHGLVLGMTVKENITLALLRRLSGWLGLLVRRKQQEIADHYVTTLSIATPSIEQRVVNLSGGNQQKVVLAKWLGVHPKLLIMDEPTRGIDVGAKAEVHSLMNRLAREGMGILMISSELPEILGMSDSIIVMCRGRITGRFRRGEASQQDIMSCATQFAQIDAS